MGYVNTLFMKVRKSDYVYYSRFMLRKLYSSGCWGKGSMYEDNVLKGLPDKGIAKQVLKALLKQKIIREKKKKYGKKYYLNDERREKIGEIIKEKGSNSIIPVLLMI